MTTPPVLEPVTASAGRGRTLLPVLIILLVATAVAVALTGGAILGLAPDRTVAIGPGFDGRILVGLPTGDGVKTHLLRDGVEVNGSPRTAVSPGGCPVLLRTADGIAVRDRWKGYRFESFAGDIGSGWFSTNYHGGERWSADHAAFALIDMENAASVLTFPDGDLQRPTVTTYPAPGSIEGFFSTNGTHLALAVPDGRGSLAIHALAGGVDEVVATVPFLGRDGYASGTWSPDARSLLLVTIDANGERLSIVHPGDGSVRRVARPRGLPASATLVPLDWSPNGMYAVVGSGTGAAWILDTMRGDWYPLETSLAPWEHSLRWSPDGELGVIAGTTLRIHRSDGHLDRSVALPGAVTTWSPDGAAIASLVNATGSPVGVWVTDAWGAGGSRQVALLHPRDPTSPAHADLTCIQWQPEVTP